jgi:glycerol-3-phosphate acyltransferase PlsY
MSTVSAWLPLALAAGGGYLAGSVPFGLLLTRIAGLGDVRKIGSGNIGATNVLRTGRKGLAAATLLLDALKGTFAVIVAVAIAGPVLGPAAALAAALGAFAGHCFPVWLGFKGGKGVATFLGVLAAVDWRAGVIFAGLWLITAFASRYSSLSALIATAASPVALWFLVSPAAAAVFALLAAICWQRHSANISRLIAGTESRIGAKG